MNKKMYLLTTRPIDDALKDCKILSKKGVNAIASPSMGIIKNKLTLKSRYDGVFLTSRNAAHIIKILDNKKKEFARGLSSFSSEEVKKIMGYHSNEIQKILGYVSKSEVVHKDDMVEI